MARVTTIKCDICGKETPEIVGKMFYTTVARGHSANGFQNHYELHLDVGSCCAPRVKKSWGWRKRIHRKKAKV